jgi:hypothetical protein
MLCSKCHQTADLLLDCGLCADCHTLAEERRLAIIGLARSEHQENGQVEIDDNAQLSEGADNGCYVQAWVWVDFASTRFDEEKTKKTKGEDCQCGKTTRTAVLKPKIKPKETL